MKPNYEKIFGPQGPIARHHKAYEYRPEQARMAEAVHDAIAAGHHLCVEAGTGTGKTLAYLIPAINSGKRVIISTGTKNLQEQLFFKDIPFLKKALDRKLSVCYMKGRANYLCLLKLEHVEKTPKLYGFFDQHLLRRIKAWARRTSTGDRAELAELPEDFPLWRQLDARRETCLGQKCKLFKPCYVTQMRQLASSSDIIIVNHHLFFADLALKEWEHGSVLPNYQVVIFDEAHELEDVATSYFGISVSNYRIEELARDVEHALAEGGLGSDELSRALANLPLKSEKFFSLFARQEGRYRIDKSQFCETAADRASYISLLNGLEILQAELRKISEACEDEDLSDELSNLARRAVEIRDELVFIIESEDPMFVYWYEVRGRGVFLQASPIDLAQLLEQMLFDKVECAVLTSATLSTGGNFEFIKRRLGIRRCDELVLGTHFDYRKQAILYIPRHLTDPREDEFPGGAASEIARVLSITQGRAFVLFTSYQKMQRVHQILKGSLPFPLFMQGEMSRSEILNRFRGTPNSVLFATSSFWQGVDVQGEALSCVIIDKLPFSVPSDPIVAARMEYIAGQGGDPFYEYQVPEAIILLKQGLGRLIRSRSDRGVLCILDKRILTRSYGPAFLASLPPCRITHSIDDVRAFWENAHRLDRARRPLRS